ncbi:hypothetical protein Hanom_Chr11g01044361 [Helianthus anomalus]
MENESLGELATMFHHLFGKMFSFNVVATSQEIVARFIDALLAKWNGFLEILKHNGDLDT